MEIQLGNTIINLPVYVGITGLTLSASGSKNGSSMSLLNGVVSELGAGYYSVSANATDANSLGSLTVVLSDGIHTGHSTFTVAYNSIYNGQLILNSMVVSGSVFFESLNVSTLDCEKIDYILGLIGHNAGARNFIGPASQPTGFDICYYDNETDAATNDGITGLIHKWTLTTTYNGSGNVIAQNTKNIS